MMTLDPELLDKANAAASRLTESERDALLARADYHALIRRLHLGGGSFREIAQALGLSHQRVQQIVESMGGTWWQRIWRTRSLKRDAVCTFCLRSPSEVSKLIAGPNVYICDSCITSAERAMRSDSRPAAELTLARRGARPVCSFCSKWKSAQRPVITSRRANVCGDCLRICREILTDRNA